MKRLISSVFIVFTLLACSDKVEIGEDQAKTFNKFYGNSGVDEGCEIRELDNGDFLIFGNIQTTNSGLQLALIRTDKFGNEQWTQLYGREGDELAGGFDIHRDNGNIIMVGTSLVPGASEGDDNYSDIIVVEVDQTGAVIEQRIFDGQLDNEVGKDILYDYSDAEGYMVVGSTDAFSDFVLDDPGNTANNQKGSKDFLVLRYYINDQGSFETRFTQVGYNGNDEFLSLVASNNSENSFFAAGYSSKFILEQPITSIMIRLENVVESTADFVGIENLKIDGDIVFKESSEVIKLINVDNSRFGALVRLNSASESAFIYEFNSELKKFSDNPRVNIDRGGVLKAGDISYDSNSDSYLLAGSTNISTGGGFDHYLASISRSGSINWQKTFGGAGDEEALGIWPTNDGGYVFTGFSGFEGNSLINVIKTDNSGNLNP